MALQHDGTAVGRHGGRSREAEERDSGDEEQWQSFGLGRQQGQRAPREAMVAGVLLCSKKRPNRAAAIHGDVVGLLEQEEEAGRGGGPGGRRRGGWPREKTRPGAPARASGREGVAAVRVAGRRCNRAAAREKTRGRG